MANKIFENNTTNNAVEKQSLKESGKKRDKEIDGIDEVFSGSSMKTLARYTVEQLSKAYKPSGCHDLTFVYLYFQTSMFALSTKSSISALHVSVWKN